MPNGHQFPIRVAFLALALSLSASVGFAADAERQVERTLAARPGLIVELRNLAGNVTLVKASGTEVRLRGTIHAAGASSAEAERIAGLLSITADESGALWLVKAVYPLDEHRKYHYPRRDDDESLPWFLEWLDIGSSSFKYEERQVHIVSQSSPGALTLYADFRLELPEGVGATIRNGVGVISSTGVRGDQRLDISTGEVSVRDSSGKLGVDTGSGDVAISRHAGDVGVDTGSGEVTLEEVQAGLVQIDTGSGDIRLTRVSGSFDADTGSGDILGSALTLGSKLLADTGSGDIRLSGDLSALAQIDIDTGSGDVTLEASPTSAAPNVRLSVGTGSGEVSFDLPAGRVTRSGDGDLTAVIGSATGTASISTGSGDVVVRGAS